MAFRFNKRIKIAPGIRLNLGLGGASVSVGGKGASVNLSKRGVSAGVSIPGTGISYRKKLSSSSNNRALQREKKATNRLEKAQERVGVLAEIKILLDKETGVVIINDGNDEPLKGKEKTIFWEQQSQRVENWLIDQADEINGNVDLLKNLHFDMPSPDSELKYAYVSYGISKPKEPTPIKQISYPIEETVEPLGLFAGLFASNKKKHQEKVTQLKNNFNQLVQKYKSDVAILENEHSENVDTWGSEVRTWQEDKEKHGEEQEANAIKFIKDIKTDKCLMESILALEIGAIEWPRETLISYSIEDNGNSVWLDVDLPEIEDIPQKVAKLSANKRYLIIKNKAKKQLQLEYAHHIHAIALRLSAYCLFTVPSSQEVIVSGYSQRLNLGTGYVNEDYLYSIKFTREGMCVLNYDDIESIDPISAVGVFEHKRKITATGIMKKIEPFTIPQS